ncbi:hypothetical protein F444_13462 [Phytophthora nicotianae P1976]|uniref:Uncharacterized protein n=1 Tax=Phytophthora nicotianae P1976 TaxID=1317066 RepID=A0A080ZTR6_PHYNI|nr:hypothetical protein F444_13462 [Phytophthora nicotianae P1976]
METISDEAFLKEVECFLDSCGSPLDSVMDTTTECSTNDSSPDLRLAVKPPPPQSNHTSTKRTAGILSVRDIDRAKDRKRRKQYRERRRLEREMLERQVKDLSHKYWRIQQTRQANYSLSATAWRTIAEQQLEALQIAELEQQRLKLAVESRSRLIQEMHQRLGTEETLSKVLNFDRHRRVQIGTSDVDILETYLREIDTVYAQTDHAFQTLRNDSKSLSKWVFDAATGFSTFADRRDIAFDFKLASQVLWQLAHTLARKEYYMLYEHQDGVSNTIAFKLRITRRLDCGRSVSMVQSMVGRRYSEEDRLVVVWKSFTEGEGLFCGMHSDETGWSIAQPSGILDGVGTSLAICMRHKPMHFSNTDNELGKEQFSRLLHTMGSEDFVEITSSLENHLANQVVC